MLRGCIRCWLPPRNSCAGPFGTFGLVGGLLAGSLFAPGCGVSEDESVRLRIGLPLLGMSIFLLAALVVFRLLRLAASRQDVSRKRAWTIPKVVGIVVVAFVLLASVTVLLHSGVSDRGRVLEHLENLPLAFALLGPVFGPSVVGLPLVAYASSLALEATGSAVSIAAGRVRWSLVAAATHVGGATMVVLHNGDPPLDRTLLAAGFIGSAILLLLSVRAAACTVVDTIERSRAARGAATLPVTAYRTPVDPTMAAGRQRKQLESMTFAALVISLAATVIVLRIWFAFAF